MKKRRAASLCLLFVLPLLSGCWDRSEVNDIALELAWGIDSAPDDKVMISAQAIIPAKISAGQNDGASGGGKGKPYFVVASDGLNTLDAVQRMQAKMSRQVFRGHRRVIVIGEDMARRGIKDIFDTYTRDPNLKLRTDIFIVKNDTAKHFLQVPYPLETIPGIGALGEYNQIGTVKEMALLNFLLAATSAGASPALPAIAIGMDAASEEQEEKGFRIAGTAILNKELKLVGYLNIEEGRSVRWVSGQLKKLMISSQVPGEEGNVSMDVIHTKSDIRPSIRDGKLNFAVTLTGRGAIRENNTSLDLTQTKNISLLQKTLNRHVEETVLHAITKVQQAYGTDVFGFSEVIRRKDMPLWNAVKSDWESAFREAEVSVNASLTVRRIGVTGPALQLNPNEVKK